MWIFLKLIQNDKNQNINKIYLIEMKVYIKTETKQDEITSAKSYQQSYNSKCAWKIIIEREQYMYAHIN
jgi:hypothetical protein